MVAAFSQRQRLLRGGWKSQNRDSAIQQSSQTKSTSESEISVKPTNRQGKMRRKVKKAARKRHTTGSLRSDITRKENTQER